MPQLSIPMSEKCKKGKVYANVEMLVLCKWKFQSFQQKFSPDGWNESAEQIEGKVSVFNVRRFGMLKVLISRFIFEMSFPMMSTRKFPSSKTKVIHRKHQKSL